MPSITQQKADLKDLLLRHIHTVYDESSDEDRRHLVAGLATRLMAKMTLSELRAWHQKVSITTWMAEDKRSGGSES